MRRLFLPLLVGLCLAGFASTAAAQSPLQKVLDLNRQAMDAYTNLDIERADKLLKKALEKAQSGGVTGAPLARTYLNLGVVAVGGFQDNAQGLQYFTKALETDSTIQLDPLTSTPDIKQVFKLAKTRVGGSGSGGGSSGGTSTGGGSSTSGGSSSGGSSMGGGSSGMGASAGGGSGSGRPQRTPSSGNIPHEPVPEQLTQTAVPVFVEVPSDAPVGQVYLYYKGGGMGQYKRVQMQRMQGGFGYEIPCSTVFPPKVSYYIVAFGKDGSPLGFAGSADNPITVSIVQDRTQAPPALPGQAPPEKCSLENECPPGMAGCNDDSGGGGAGMGETCRSTTDCRAGLICEDNFCVSPEEVDDEGNKDDEGGEAPDFFLNVGFTGGLGWASSGMWADRQPPEGLSEQQRASYIPSTNENCTAPDGEYCVRVETPGFLFTPALRLTLGYYFYKGLGAAATLRYQFNAGRGPLASTLIGLRLQYRFLEAAPSGWEIAAFLGGSFGQIQLQPPQNGADEPYATTGLNGVQVGSSITYRIVENFGLFATPEVNVLFPNFMFGIDVTAGAQVSF